MPNFSDDRLRGSGVVAGQISAFPIDFAGRPYNTLTLPCERVILTESGEFYTNFYFMTNEPTLWDLTPLHTYTRLTALFPGLPG